MEEFGAIVVGAGVVGLAVTRALALTGHQVLLLDAEPHFGSWTSSRNSEVIHAGLYYPPGSLKARCCVEGRDLLYAFCEKHAVPYRQLGKLIFAHDSGQIAELNRIAARATAAGVDDLQRLSRAEARRLEPALDVAEALLSPSTGIIDSHGFMLALLGEAEAQGAQFVANTAVARIDYVGEMWRVFLAGDAEAVVEAPILINSAGLAAQSLATTIEALDRAHIPPIYFARGVYFTYSGKVPFDRLIYPVPEPGGIGTHLTLDLAGQARFGPDVEWIDTIDYTVDPGRKPAFVAAARRIWPDLDADRLHPGYAGIRPKLTGPGEPAADFMISGPRDHGLSGLISLFGIESPGLTSALSLAEQVMATLR